MRPAKRMRYSPASSTTTTATAPPPPPPSFEAGVGAAVTLNEEQKRALVLAKMGYSLFLTGGAGTGKSFLLGHIVERLRRLHKDPEAVAVTASTGLALLPQRYSELADRVSCRVVSCRVVSCRWSCRWSCRVVSCHALQEWQRATLAV
jgi:hypothetical protein